MFLGKDQKELKRFIIPVLVTLGIIFLLFTQISLNDLYQLFKNIDLLWGLLGIAGYLFALLFRAFRYRWLIHSRDVSIADLFRISTFYHLSLMVLPSKLGELSYPYFLNKLSGMPMTEGLASLIASRIFDFFTILMIFFIASIGFHRLFNVNPFWMVILTAFFIGLTLLALFYMVALLRLSSRAVGKMSQWFNLSTHQSIRWFQQKIHDMAEDFLAIKAKQTYVAVTLATLASWIMSYWMFFAFLKSFRVSASFMDVVFGSTIAIIANVLPISGIGNWGVLEAGWAAGFILVGLSKVDAIATGFGVHILLFLTSAAVSFLGWITLKKHESPSH
jgi:glycosyltransferase 2 family protein